MATTNDRSKDMSADERPVEVVAAWDGDRFRVFLMFDAWAHNRDSVQSAPLTLDQVRALALELLEAADVEEAGR
jgi:hypothetical protein